jgi:hypothetical protein
MNEFRPIIVSPDETPHLNSIVRLAKEQGAVIITPLGIEIGTEHIRAMTGKRHKPVILGLGEDLPKIDVEALTKTYLNKFNDIDFLLKIANDSMPTKLDIIKKMELSPEQIDYFKYAPPHRLEGESQEDYKIRRMLNKLLIKYRGKY